VNYTIIHVNDRAKESMDHNKSILNEYTYVNDIEFFNGNTGNAWDVINHYGIKKDVWAPYDGRPTPPLPGELGIWVSTINVWKYMAQNHIDRLLVLEDDVLLDSDFTKNLQLCMGDLPDNFDFLSLYYFKGHNWEGEETDIGSKYVHKSTNQYSAAQATVYSLNGARKLLRAVTRKGIEYTTDCFIFRQSLLGVVNGYSIRPNNLSMLSHQVDKVTSLIDPANVRNTDNS
jgi:GR25 family glycosyltransferase involved in LPS biosynthesis